MLHLYFIFCTYLKFSLICYSDTFLKLAVKVIIKLLHLWVTFLNSAACISSFCSLPQAGKVYYTYFIGMKTEVQSSKVMSLWVREVVNSKAGARNSIFGFLALFLSTLSLFTNSTADPCPAASTWSVWQLQTTQRSELHCAGHILLDMDEISKNLAKKISKYLVTVA